MNPTEGLSTSEREELERLRAEVADLRARGHGRAGRGWRWTAVIALMTVAGLLFSASVVAVYVRTQLLNTDRYVQTVAPLARDPVIQNAITDRLTDEFMTRLDIAGLTQQLIDQLQQRGAPDILNQLAGPITNGVRSFVSSQIHNIVASDTFAQVWDSANRVAHEEIDAVLTTGHGRILTSQGTEVSVNVGALLTIVKQKLVDSGFGLAANVPDVSITMPLFHSDQLPRIRTYVSLLNTAAWMLPLLTLVLLVAGVAVAPNRRRGLLIAAVALFVSMTILLAALVAARSYYLNHLPTTVQSPDAVRVVVDNQIRFLKRTIQTLLVFFAIVIAACWAFGPGPLATALRRSVDIGLDAAGHGLARTGAPLGPVPAFLRRYHRTIAVAVVVLAVAVLVIWETPGVAGVLWLTVGVLVLLGLVEIVARAGDTTTTAATPSVRAPA